MPKVKKRVVIADDHAMFRSGLIRVLSDFPEIEILGAVGTSAELLDLLQSASADLVILDLSMPGVVGLSLIDELHSRYADLPILVLTMHDEPATVRGVLKAGACGFITKTCDIDILTTAIDSCCRRERFVSPNLAVRLALSEVEAEDPKQSPAQLTQREFEVLDLIMQGLPLTEIGTRLNLSRKTITTHKANLMLKLGVTSNMELYRVACECFPDKYVGPVS